MQLYHLPMNALNSNIRKCLPIPSSALMGHGIMYAMPNIVLLRSLTKHKKKNCSLWISWKDDAAGDAAYQGRINNIERECVRNLIEHLSADKRIVGDCHDNNSAISNLVKDTCPITEYLDPNHTLKSFAKKFKKPFRWSMRCNYIIYRWFDINIRCLHWIFMKIGIHRKWSIWIV